MEFWKMNGNGNDFVVIDNRERSLDDEGLSDFAIRVCRRRRSIGADGILVVENSSGYDFRMRIFNADGSEGEMCGNGARCMARYAFDRSIAPSCMTFETLAGPIGARVEGVYVVLDMGDIDISKGWLDGVVEIEGNSIDADFLIVGVPHLVLYAGDPDELGRDRLLSWGRELRNRADLFSEGTNVNFVFPLEDGSLRVTTYERGVEDLTDSCGTGSTASALASARRFCMVSPIKVLNPGGINTVSFEENSETCFKVSLGGNTSVAAVGTVESEA